MIYLPCLIVDKSEFTQLLHLAHLVECWSKLFLAAGYKFLCLDMRAYFVRQNRGLLNRSKREETGVILFHLWQEIQASIVNGWNPIWLETHYRYLDLKIALNVKLLLALSAKLPLFVPLCGCEINSEKKCHYNIF